MAKDPKPLVDNDDSMEVKITPEFQKSIEDIIFQKRKIAVDKEALKEALDALADRMGTKSGILSKRVDMIIKEEEKGGEVKSKTDDLNFVEQYFVAKDNANK